MHSRQDKNFLERNREGVREREREKIHLIGSGRNG